MQTENNKLAAAIADANPVASSCEQYLLARYGATMSLANVAAELGTTANALRIRQLRCADLPPRIPGVRGYRWPTMTIAAWINGLVGQVDQQVATEPQTPAKPNRPGRPRKHVSPDVGQRGGV